MKLTVPARDLSSALSTISGVIQSASTIQILQHVKIVARNGSLSLTSSDMMRQCDINISADVETPGETTAPGKMLHSLASTIPSDAAVSLTVSNNRLIVTSGKKAAFSLPTIDAKDFPSILDGDLGPEVEMSGDALSGALSRVRYAMSTDASRWYLQGARVETKDNRMYIVATCGHRLAATCIDVQKDPPAVAATIPRDAVAEMIKIASAYTPVFLRFSESFVSMSADNVRFISKLITDQFPDWRRLMPSQDVECSARVDKSLLVAATDRVSAIMTDAKSPMLFDIGDDEVRLAGSGEKSSSTGKDAMDAKTEGRRMTVRYSPAYVAQTLSAMGEGDVDIKVSNPSGPSLWTSVSDPKSRFLIMPMSGKVSETTESE